MQKILFLFVLLIAAPGVQAQQTDLIANIAGRRTIDLDGQWKTIIDPYELGARDVSGRTGFFKDNKPESKSDLIEYGFDSLNHSMCQETGIPKETVCFSMKGLSGIEGSSI